MKSFWKEENENHKEFRRLEEDIDVQVCVIGGGLSGLSVAYYLSNAKMNVAIIEKDKICSGTSGKSTGKLTSQHGLFYSYLVQSKGKEFAKKYLEANENAIDNIEGIIKKEKIKCDFERQKAYVYATKEENLEKISNENTVVSELKNGKSKLVDNIELPIKIKSAIEFGGQAQFHPVKYGYGLANCIIKNNGKIFEDSKAFDVKSKDGRYLVSANGHKILADYVVIATRYPIINAPGFHFLKMYQSTSYCIVLDTKSDLFNGMYISEELPTVSFRTVEYKDKKLLLVVGYDYKTGKSDNIDGYEKLEVIAKEMYPEAELLYKWSAEDCITLDKIPYIGKFSSVMNNVYVATGFNKWGLTSSNIAGKIISDEILGKENEYTEVFKATRFEMIKNRDEFGNMLKETGNSLVANKLKVPSDILSSVKLGEGKIVNVDGKKIGVYKNELGEIYSVNPVCTHLGCELTFNNVDKVWECPCHGSKFNYDGKSIEVPSIKEMNKMDIN